MKERDLRVRVCQAELCNHVCAGDLPNYGRCEGSRSDAVDIPTFSDEGRAGAEVGPVRARIEDGRWAWDCLPSLPSEL